MDTTQKLYLDSIFQFANTLTLKFPMAAKLRNNYLKALGYVVDPDDKSTWAYYMNLAGEYHESDTLMTIVSMDTLETIDFTYNNLLLHRATKAAYVWGSDYYEALVERYPEQETLIRGILNPVPVETSIAANDWEILYYDTSLVEEQEVYFIEELQRWISRFTTRWFLPFPAEVQSQYPGTFFAILFQHLVGEIINIRNRYTRTSYTHSYHLWSYLGSHSRLNVFKDYASLKQTLFLYRNIAYIDAHAGRTSTFVDLIANILTDRGIPLTSYEIQQDLKDLTGNIYTKGIVAKLPENSLAQSVTGVQRITIEEALTNELEAAKDNSDYLYDQKIAVPARVKNAITNVIPTKVLESVMVDQSDAMPRKFVDTLLAEWMFLSTNGRYVANIAINNPLTQETMNMTVKEAMILWIYCVMSQYEYTLTEIPDVTAFYAQRIPVPTYSELRGATEEKYVSELGIQLALTEVTPVTTIISTEAFYGTCASVHGNVSAHRMMYTSQQDFRARGQWEVLCNRFYAHVKCSLFSGKMLYADWFKEKNWDLNFTTTAEYTDFAVALFTAATGTDLRTTISVSDIHTAMVGIMTQLSSYGVQYIHKTLAAPGTVLDNMAIRFGAIESKSRSKYQVPFRVEVINQKQRAKLSPNKPPFVGVNLGVDAIKTTYHFNLQWGIGFLADTSVRTNHRIPIAEVRFKGNLSKDIALDIPYTELPGLWLYYTAYRPLNDVVTTTRLPGLWLVPPDGDPLLQGEILNRRLNGLNLVKVPAIEKLTLSNTELDGLYMEDIPRYQLWELFDVGLDGFVIEEGS